MHSNRHFRIFTVRFVNFLRSYRARPIVDLQRDYLQFFRAVNDRNGNLLQCRID